MSPDVGSTDSSTADDLLAAPLLTLDMTTGARSVAVPQSGAGTPEHPRNDKDDHRDQSGPASPGPWTRIPRTEIRQMVCASLTQQPCKSAQIGRESQLDRDSTPRSINRRSRDPAVRVIGRDRRR
jgi:hypothetical protein